MPEEEQILCFGSQAELAQWLAEHHASCDGVWLRHAKKGAPAPTVTYQEALEVALCFGWIDGIKKGEDAHYFKQRYTPRRARSIWSKINRDKALKYIEEGKMQPAGLAEVKRAQQDGMRSAPPRCRQICRPRSMPIPAQKPSLPRLTRRTAMRSCSEFRRRKKQKRARARSRNMRPCLRVTRPCIRCRRRVAPNNPSNGTGAVPTRATVL